jgi:low temperature requirement protein LtrA
MRKFRTGFANALFLLLIISIVMVAVSAGLALTGHHPINQAIAELGMMLLWGLALFGITFFPRQTRRIVSSDWLVDLLMARWARKQAVDGELEN